MNALTSRLRAAALGAALAGCAAAWPAQATEAADRPNPGIQTSKYRRR